MSRLSDLYKAMETLRKEGLPVDENLEKKRYRAIEDMCIACEDSIIERQANGNDEWLKEFIHLYFNSKYARPAMKLMESLIP